MNLIERAKNILLDPKSEWAVIAGEEPDTNAIVTGYVLPLVVFAGIMSFLSLAVKGSPLMGLVTGLITIVAGFAAVFVAAWVVDKLAPSFGSQPNFGRAMQLIAYSMTASWVGSILGVIPFLGGLLSFVASIYGIYLLYLGLPFTMQTPEDKRIAYLIVSILAVIVIYAVIGLIFTPILLVALGLHAVGAAVLG